MQHEGRLAIVACVALTLAGCGHSFARAYRGHAVADTAIGPIGIGPASLTVGANDRASLRVCAFERDRRARTWDISGQVTGDAFVPDRDAPVCRGHQRDLCEPYRWVEMRPDGTVVGRTERLVIGLQPDDAGQLDCSALRASTVAPEPAPGAALLAATIALGEGCYYDLQCGDGRACNYGMPHRRGQRGTCAEQQPETGICGNDHDECRPGLRCEQHRCVAPVPAPSEAGEAATQRPL